MQKQIHLAPQTAEEDAYSPSSATSTREFKILRKRIAADKAQLLAQITVTADQIQLMASKTYVDGIKANLEASITVNADAIALKASQSELNNLGGRVTTAESTLTVQAGQIATKVSTTDLNTTLTNYSTITQTATQIATRVATTDYNGNEIASRINQTATTIQLDASKINLSGYVTVTALGQAGATTINGSNITTGTLNADLINAGAMSVDRLTAGSVSGWYFGSNTISRNRITLGDNYIRLVGTSTSDATINFESTTNSGDVVRLYKLGNFGILGVSGGLDIGGGVTCSGLVTGAIGLNGDMYSNNLYPNVHSTSSSTGYRLGNSARSWREVWAFDTTINTSDKRLKREIEQIDKGIELILKLNPVQFKWQDGSRKHYGLIAQEVKQAMTDVGIDDSALYVDANIRDGVDTVALRYGELIAPMIQTIQHLNERIKVIENEKCN